MVAPVEAVIDKPELLSAVEKPLFGVLAHAYQPPRRFFVELPLDGKPYRAGFSVVPEVNDMITGQVYEPVLGGAESLQPGLVTSIYAPLRSYLKREKPELFEKIRQAVENTPDREYKVLGDPLVHSILPLLPGEDQQMLFSAGKRAFFNDFGFEPKGIWLPETAVTRQTLQYAAEAGYEFVPLRDNQVGNVSGNVNLDVWHNICVVPLDGGREMAVLLGNSDLSEKVSYQKWTTDNADEYMDGRKREVDYFGINPFAISDLELYGHHRPNVDKFLRRALDVQEQYGFKPLDMKEVLEELRTGTREKTTVDVWNYSSWSCPHNLGRWTGTCDCDGASEKARQDKHTFYQNLRDMNEWVNRGLDALMPDWRKGYGEFLAEQSNAIFTGANFAPALMQRFGGETGGTGAAKLLLAKTEVMVGMTSCGWFFGGDNSIERAIPANMIQGVKDLFPEQFSV